MFSIPLPSFKRALTSSGSHVHIYTYIYIYTFKILILKGYKLSIPAPIAMFRPGFRVKSWVSSNSLRPQISPDIPTKGERRGRWKDHESSHHHVFPEGGYHEPRSATINHLITIMTIILPLFWFTAKKGRSNPVIRGPAWLARPFRAHTASCGPPFSRNLPSKSMQRACTTA